MIDKHMHTPFCPHGTHDEMETYVQTAIQKGIREVTFTEHAPLPITDPVPSKDSSMRMEDVEKYLKEVQRLAEKYDDQLIIHAGFEVDYLEGYEKETQAFLETYPETVPHSILSVHFLQVTEKEYFCIDYDKDNFVQKGAEVGFETLYKLYEKTLQKALKTPYGEWTPKKIGHINLIHKFEKAYELQDPINWHELLKLAKQQGYVLDYNFAGLDKEFYGKTYPSPEIMKLVKKEGMTVETGSDAHEAKDVGRYFAVHQ